MLSPVLFSEEQALPRSVLCNSQGTRLPSGKLPLRLQGSCRRCRYHNTQGWGWGVSPVEKSFLENPNELFSHFIGGNWVIYLFLKSSPSKRTGISATGMAESGFYSESCEAKVCDWTKWLLPGRQEHVRPLTCLLRSFGKLVTEKKGKHTPNTTFFFFTALQSTFYNFIFLLQVDFSCCKWGLLSSCWEWELLSSCGSQTREHRSSSPDVWA